jgi:hypothetical protein
VRPAQACGAITPTPHPVPGTNKHSIPTCSLNQLCSSLAPCGKQLGLPISATSQKPHTTMSNVAARASPYMTSPAVRTCCAPVWPHTVSSQSSPGMWRHHTHSPLSSDSCTHAAAGTSLSVAALRTLASGCQLLPTHNKPRQWQVWTPAPIHTQPYRPNVKPGCQGQSKHGLTCNPNLLCSSLAPHGKQSVQPKHVAPGHPLPTQ